MNTLHSQLEQRLLVGVFGGAASGKDTVARFFEEDGFVHVSSSDILREEIAARGLVTSRELQTQVADEMREKYGAGYWVDRSMSRVEQVQTKVIVSGLYAPGEGEYLVNSLGGVLVGVVTGDEDDAELRYLRLSSRASGPRDGLSFAEFMAAHERENGGTTHEHTNLGQLLHMANFIISNTADLGHLHEQTRIVIKELEGKKHE